MEHQQEFEAPVPNEVYAPREWINTRGAVRWTDAKVNERCEDCLHRIIDWLHGHRPPGQHAPGLARMSDHRRTQGGRHHVFCRGHYRLRKAKEDSDG